MSTPEPRAARAAERLLLATYRDCVAAGRPVPAEVAEGIAALFSASQGRVYAACRRIVGSEEAARDLAQEALLTGRSRTSTTSLTDNGGQGGSGGRSGAWSKRFGGSARRWAMRTPGACVTGTSSPQT
jgi:hypothetical protein